MQTVSVETCGVGRYQRRYSAFWLRPMLLGMTLLVAAGGEKVQAQVATQSCDTMTVTNTYGLPGTFYFWVEDSFNQVILSQNLSLAASQGTSTISLGSLSLSAGSSYTVKLEVYGSSGYGYGFSNYTLALPSNLSFSGGVQTESGYIMFPNATATYTFTKKSDGACPSLVDPIGSTILNRLSFLDESSESNAQILATSGREVQGVAAEGTSKLLVRIPASVLGESFSVTVLKEDQKTASLDISAEGGVATIDQANGSTFGSSVPFVSSVATGGATDPYEAFVVYSAPLDFVRDDVPTDPAAKTRTVYLSILPSGSSSPAILVPVTIVRPPVILIHGINSSPSDTFGNFQPVASDPRFAVSRVDYSNQIPSETVLLKAPGYYGIAGNSHPIYANQMGLTYNALSVLQQIQQKISDFRNSSSPGGNLPIAVSQADIVAHSMGGLITMMIPRSLQASFYSPDNYNNGSVHKMITIGTPFLGSPLPSAELAQESDGTYTNLCVDDLLGIDLGPIKSKAPIITAQINGAVYNGGALDLCDSCNGGGISAELQAIQKPVDGMPPMKIAMLGGLLQPGEYSKIDSFGFFRTIVHASCQVPSAASEDPTNISQNLTGAGWPILLGFLDANSATSDGIVNVNSALNGPSPLHVADETTLFDAIHSKGTAFIIPNVIDLPDQPSGLPARVLDLLNTPVSNPAIFTSH
jgi:pimeloyl-ACP methyl ester carboxylesterase